MPKTKQRITVHGTAIHKNQTAANRIGNRKSGKHAATATTDELKQVEGKYKPVALKELARRAQ